MPPALFALLLATVILAAGVTVAVLSAGGPAVMAVALPVALAAALLARLILRAPR